MVANLVVLVAYPAVPVAIVIAVLRYRLYDIDRLVSRTLGWGIATAAVLGARPPPSSRSGGECRRSWTVGSTGRESKPSAASLPMATGSSRRWTSILSPGTSRRP